MTERNYFIETCIENGIEQEKAEIIWSKMNALQDHIREHWDRCKLMTSYDKEQRLLLRQQAAEAGAELTPDELDKLIKTVAIVQNRMEEEESL